MAVAGESSLYLHDCTLSVELGFEVQKINFVIKTQGRAKSGSPDSINILLCMKPLRSKGLSPSPAAHLRMRLW